MPPDAASTLAALALWRELGAAYDEIAAELDRRDPSALVALAERIGSLERLLAPLLEAASAPPVAPDVRDDVSTDARREIDGLVASLVARHELLLRAATAALGESGAELARVQRARRGMRDYASVPSPAARLTSRVA